MDPGTSPCPWRVVQLWDRSPGQDTSIRGRFGVQMAKLQCGKRMLEGNSNDHLQHHCGCTRPWGRWPWGRAGSAGVTQPVLSGPFPAFISPFS